MVPSSRQLRQLFGWKLLLQRRQTATEIGKLAKAQNYGALVPHQRQGAARQSRGEYTGKETTPV